jgi:hypothetical protein
MSFRFIVAFVWILSLQACGGSGPSPQLDARTADAGVPPPVSDKPAPSEHGPQGKCGEVAQLFVTRMLAQPRGTEVDLVLSAAPDAQLSAERDYAACIEGGAAWRRVYEGSLTLLLVRPERPLDETLAALEAFVKARPETEAIALALWTEQVTAVDLPTHDRARTMERLQVALSGAKAGVTSSNRIPRDAAALLRSLGDSSVPLMRSLVLWAPNATEAWEPPLRTPNGYSVLTFATQPMAPDLMAQAASLSTALDARYELGFYGVGLCQSGAVTLTAGHDQLELTLPELPSELANGPGCDPDLTAVQGFPALKQLDFAFTDVERER